jgi:hypothetical protein
MKEKFFIFFGLIILIIALIGLNAASYVQKEKMPDSELTPNRSTYNTGATGARAFYDLLAETGRKPVRWHEPPSALAGLRENKPATFVIIGQIRREFTDDEILHLMRWVTDGGRLIIIDREPPSGLIATTANWSISAISESLSPIINIDPSDQKQMTAETKAAKAIQPTIYTKNINAVQPSRFASSVKFERFTDSNNKNIISAPAYSSPTPLYGEPDAGDYGNEPPKIITEKSANRNEENSSGGENGIGFGSGSAQPSTVQTDEKIESPAQTAPVVHLANNEKNLLIDFPFGAGQIVFLTDPYIVSNSGINLVDNAQLGINIVASRDGIIAFDEYHQGYGTGENRLLSYFSGTPVLAIFLQFAALIALVFYSQSRRFARPLPADEPNRLSKLEYVAAMAELQRRTKGFDLALENIYTEFRRRVARLVGVDNHTTSRKDLSQMIADRLSTNEFDIYQLMKKCEDIAHGEPTNKKEVLDLVSRLRDLEEKLGLKRTRKQIFRK